LIRISLYPLLALIVTVVAAFAAAMIVVVPVLNPPLQDVQLLFLFMGGSGGATVGVVYVLYKKRLAQWFNSLRWTLLAIILLTVLLVFLNVFVTAQLMFISAHDLVLTTGLLIFAGMIAVISALLIASSLIERIHVLGEATQRLARGELHTRLKAEGNDELAQLAALFNQMAAQLEVIDREKRLLEQSRRDLVAWASHDLRTPLAAVRAMNEAMLDGVVADSETMMRYRQQIHREVEHLGRLIDDLFEIVQMDAGHLNLTRTLTSLSNLIGDTLNSISARAAQRNVTVISDIEDGLPVVYIAPDKIQRVLYNLLDNAIHHTPPDGQVTISARQAGAGVQVSVHNTGSVIPAEDQPRIFERFYRGERSRARGSSGDRGTGLGLAIARGFVEAHGGSINVTSEAGRGTTFTFILP
jgi:signal transduction histidine kinase